MELINTQSGARRAIGSLSGVPLNSDELYLGQSGGFNADASKVLLSEQIVRVQPTVIDGSTRLIVPPGGFLAFSASLVRTSDGALVADITQRINTRAGGNAFIQGFIQMSGDANAFSFASSVDLSNPSLPLWSQVTANGPRIRRAPYVYFLDSDQIVSVVSIDVTQPRQGGSSLVFLRNIGRTGTVFGIERGVSYIGAPPNPSGATNPATLVLGQVPQYITPPGALPPARGFFANSFALISPEEDRVYFQHTADLVPGNNLIQSQEIFSIQLSNRQIRQISRQQDTIGVRFANEPTLLFQYGDLAQIVYAGSSADHRVVAYSNNRPGGFTRTVKDVDAQGRTTIRAARFGTAEYPAWEVRRIMVCQ